MKNFTIFLGLLYFSSTAFSQSTIFSDGFESATGWTLAGEFEIAAPSGLGGSYGNSDPSSAYAGSNVLGVDLTGIGSHSGDYENNIGNRAYTAISPIIDCSSYGSCRLKFQRYLNVEGNSYDHAYIDISNDGGSSWTNIWANGGSTITDNSWSLINIDISSYADGNANVKIRFAIGSTDGGWTYSGWNIDDFLIEGVSTCSSSLYRWTGSVNTNWGTAGNWCSNAVPTSSVDVIIPGSGITNWPVLNVNGNCRDLTIESGAQLNGSSNNLNVYGDWTNNGTFNSGTGSVYFVGSSNVTVTVSGASQTVLSDGFESGTSGWTLGSLSSHSEWRRQSGGHSGSYDCALYDLYHSSSHNYYHSSAANNLYLDLKRTIDLSDYSSASITFYWRSGADNQSYPIFSVDGDVLADDMKNNSSWQSKTISLNSYCGNSDMLMFYRMWVGSDVSGTPGLCIDDITITGTPNVEHFNNVYIQKTGATVTLSSSIKTKKDIVITSGTLDANGYNLTIGRNFTNNSTFTSGTGTAKFNGTSTQTISGSSNTSFYNFIKNTSSDLVFSGNSTTVTIANSFTWKDNDDKISIDGTSMSVIINDEVFVNMGCELDVNNNSTISIAKNFQNLGTIDLTTGNSILKFHSNTLSYVLTEPGDTIFSDDFETDPFGSSSNWYFDQGNDRSDWHWTNGQQHSGSYDLAVMDNHGSTQYYYDYQWDGPEDSCIAKIDIDLTGYTGAILEFWWRCGGDDPDQAGYDGDYGQVFINDVPVTEKLWGQQSYKKHPPISLANYAGQTITLKFKFQQDGTWNGGHAASPGLCIDDILVYANCKQTLHVHDLLVSKSNNSTSTVVLCPVDANDDITITKGILDASGNNISLEGNWTNASGTGFLPRRDTVTFDGSSDKTVDIGSNSFATLYVNKPSATLTISNNTLDVDSNLRIFSNSTLKSGGENIEVGKDWLNYGTFTHDNNTVTFDGTSTIHPGGTTAGKRFYNLTLDGTSAILDYNIRIDNNFTITSGTFDVSSANRTIRVFGNFTCDDTFTERNGIVLMRNSGGSISFSSDATFYDLQIDKWSGTKYVTCLSNFSVTHNITFTNGGIDLKNRTISLGTTGSLVGETNDNRIFATDGSGTEGAGTGTITATRTNPSGNIAGLGCEITPGSAMGNTTITRGHLLHTDIDGLGHASIFRYFDISPANNSGLNATFRFHYFEGELHGQTETQLEQWRSTDGGSTWTNRNGTVNTGSDYVELTGISAFSRWTLSGKDFPLPITLLNQEVKCIDEGAEISWITESEINNDFYTIERSVDGYSFEELGIVLGAGNSNEINSYSFIDDNLQQDLYYYRIRQTDFDGTFTSLNILTSNCVINKSDIDLDIEYHDSFINAIIKNTEGRYTIILGTMSGKIIKTSVVETLDGKIIYPINKAGLEEGMYYISFKSNTDYFIKKIVIKH